MLGRTVNIFKKWWVVALVFTLALSLTSCSKNYKNLSGDGEAFTCSGPAWSFEVKVTNSIYGTGLYDILVTPKELGQYNGDIAQVVLANQTGQYETKKAQVVLVTDSQFTIQGIPITELQNYDVLAIAQYEASGFLDGDSSKTTFCNLPQPGQGNGTTQASGNGY